MNTAADAGLPAFMPGVFRIAADGRAELLGSYCASCRRSLFPAVELCPNCLGATQMRALGSRGVIYSYTLVRTKPPLGLPAPYAVGYVDLADGGPRVFALLDVAEPERLAIGAPVQLRVAPLGHDGHGKACLRPLFAPLPAGAAP